MAAANDYKVELEVFEGPLDLLLYLIKKDEVDIYDIPIEKITNQYMEYLDLMRMLDLNIAGEFIVMAATLMLIKSRMLLPVEERTDVEEEEEEDPRWELVRQLVEYKKFKDAASRLQENEMLQENIFGIGGQVLSITPEESSVTLQDVSIFDLIAAFDEVIKNSVTNDIAVIVGEQVTVADKIDYILTMVKDNDTVTFSSLFKNEETRNGIICTFLALLELTKLRQLDLKQDSTFGEILISAAVDIDDIDSNNTNISEENNNAEENTGA